MGARLLCVPDMMRLTLELLPGMMAVYRLAPDAPLPSWATTGAFWSITRTSDELSVVCEDHDQPGIRKEGGWRCLRIQGPLAFTLIGVLATLTQPLADAEVGVFVCSTFDTDYLLVKAADLPRTTEALVGAGHEVTR